MHCRRGPVSGECTRIDMSEQTDRESLQAILKRGFDLLARGEVHKAGECCRQALAIKPDLVPAHFLVGLVALESRDRKTAFSAFGSVTRLQKNHAAAWAHLAKLFMSEGQVNRADAALQEARKCRSDDPMVHDLLGGVASLMGEYGEARQLFEAAVDKAPGHPAFLLNLANNLVYHGETEQAERIFARIIDIEPHSPQAHWALAGSRKATDEEHIGQLSALARHKGVTPRAQAFYYYAMGKLYEDLQQWDSAFEAFSKGAKIRRTTVEYDEAGEIRVFEFLEKHFTREWLEADGSGDTAQTGNSVQQAGAAPVFVLGQPRTGTTLIERILSSHSRVHSAGELQQFGLAIRRLSNFQDPRRFSAELFEAALDLDCVKIGELYMETTRKMQGGKPWFVDKLPQNYLFIPLILKALPNARIIHLTRDPRDACFSSFKQLFADAYLHSYDQEEMARHHVRYWHLMNVWRDRFPGRFLDVSYEQTAGDLEPNARKLIEYLGLPWEEACLHFHRQSGAVSTASAVQVREPVHTRSVGRWRQYERQLAPMLRSLEASGVELCPLQG